MKKDKKTLKSVVLAEGEATGHFHAAVGFGAVLKDNLLSIPEGAKVTHQEHGEIKIPPGKYQNIGVVEYDPLEENVRRVID